MSTLTKSIEPAWFITTKDNKVPYSVPFEKLFKQKDRILTATIIWMVNSYHVNVRKKLFIINGGQLIHAKGLEGDAAFLYARRVTQEFKTGVIDTNGGNVRKVSYILGMKSSNKEIMVQVSADGSMWRWRDHR